MKRALIIETDLLKIVVTGGEIHTFEADAVAKVTADAAKDAARALDVASTEARNQQTSPADAPYANDMLRALMAQGQWNNLQNLAARAFGLRPRGAFGS